MEAQQRAPQNVQVGGETTGLVQTVDLHVVY